MKTQEELLQALGDGPKNEWDIKSVDWDLNEESIVVEVGGYCGRWAKAICELYNPEIHVFEPQKWAFDICKESLAKYEKAEVHNFALGAGKLNGVMVMGEFGRDGASLLRTNDPDQIYVQVRDSELVFSYLSISNSDIDLMLINIEGYEYTLIPYLVECGILQRVKNLMVQFHDFAATTKEHDRVIGLINETHEVKWDYGLVLMAWSLK